MSKEIDELVEKLRSNPQVQKAWSGVVRAVDEGYLWLDEQIGKADEWFQPSQPKPQEPPTPWGPSADALKKMRESLDKEMNHTSPRVASGGLYVPCRICFLGKAYHPDKGLKGMIGHEYEPRLTDGF